MSRPDLNLLVVFDAVMAERNLRKAAERLHRSQPAISQSVARMRQVFGDVLFEKVATGVQPTPRAEALWAEMREPIQCLSRLMTGEGFDPRTAKGEIVLGLSDDVHELCFASTASAVRKQAPGLKLRVIEIDHQHVWDAVKSGEVDLAVTVAGQPPRSIGAKVLLEQTFVLVVRSDVSPPTTLEKYLKATHVAVGFRDRERGYTDERLASMGKERDILAWTPRFSSIRDLVIRLGAIATMPEPIARTFEAVGGVTLANVPFDLQPVPIRMAWHERRRNDALNAWLRKLMSENVKREMECGAKKTGARATGAA